MSNLLKRIIVGLVGIPLILIVCYMEGLYYLFFSLIITALALREFFVLLENVNYTVYKYSVILISAIILLSQYFLSFDFVFFIYAAFLILTTLELIRKNGRNPLNPVMAIFGLIYITFPFILFGELNKISEMNLMILIFILIWTSDTTAYFGGKLLGRHKLSDISPGKTIEGSVTGFAFTVLISVSVHFLFPEKLLLKESVIIGLITGIFSQSGDLFESLLKRHCNSKDSSGLIPGHGGVLDRFDSLLFAAPAVYIYIRYFK